MEPLRAFCGYLLSLHCMELRSAVPFSVRIVIHVLTWVLHVSFSDPSLGLHLQLSIFHWQRKTEKGGHGAQWVHLGVSKRSIPAL